MGHGIFGEHREAGRRDEIGNAVMHFRIDMIGMTGQNDAHLASFLEKVEHFCALFLQVVLELFLFAEGLFKSFLNFRAGDVAEEVERQEHVEQTVQFHGQEGADEFHALFAQLFHIVLQQLRITTHHRAVVAVVLREEFLALKGDARIENAVHALLDEIHDVAVAELGRIAHRLRRNGGHAAGVHFFGGRRREHHAEAQLREQGEPEGIILIHVQHTGNAYAAAGSLVRGERHVVIEQPLVLVVEEIGHAFVGSALACAALAAVAGDEAGTVGKAIHGEQTVVGTALAAGDASFGMEGGQLFAREQRGAGGGFVFFGDERRAERSHETGDVQTQHFAAETEFQGAKQGVVLEGAALRDDVFAEFFRAGNLDDLVEGVLDHGIGESRRNVADRSSFLLRLLDARIHEHGAAGAEVHGVFGVQRFVHEGGEIHAERLGKGLDEGSAAGGTRFVELNAVHHAVLDVKALDVLSSDIEHEGHVRQEELRRLAVRQGFHFVHVGMEAGPQQTAAVAGHARGGNARRGRQNVIDVFENLHCGFKGSALTRRIGLMKNAAFGVHQNGLDGGGACVDAEIDGSGRFLRAGKGVDVRPGCGVGTVPFAEGLQFLFVAEEGRQGHDVRLVIAAGEFFSNRYTYSSAVHTRSPNLLLVAGKLVLRNGIHGRPHGDEIFGVFGEYGVFLGQGQRFKRSAGADCSEKRGDRRERRPCPRWRGRRPGR